MIFILKQEQILYCCTQCDSKPVTDSVMFFLQSIKGHINSYFCNTSTPQTKLGLLTVVDQLQWWASISNVLCANIL